MKFVTKTQVPAVVDAITAWLAEKLLAGHLRGYVIGISGGLDSAVTACLARRAIDQLNRERGAQVFQLIGLSIPIHQRAAEVERGREVGALYCTEFVESDLTKVSDRLVDDMLCQHALRPRGQPDNERSDARREGNLRARLRMIYLYDTAASHNLAVLSTDNFSELMCGFWTLHGDVGDIGPIQALYKGKELPLIAEYLGIPQSVINAIPTDGLGFSTSDVEQLGAASYVEVDEEIVRYLKGSEAVNESVRGWITRTEYKRNNPDNFPRSALIEIGALQ